MRWFVLSGIVVCLAYYMVSHRYNNNVCKTFEDYYTDRDHNENCYYNPDDELPASDVIKRWGYPVESYKALTDDGYILTVFRIPHGKHSSSNEIRQPVLLQHGYKSNSKCFISTGEKSLAFVLAEQGYDVWLGNFRGTEYSRNHSHLNVSDEKFWDYSFHEMGTYDTAAQVDLVHKMTKQKIIYIGFSLGTTTAAIYSSTRSEEAEQKVKIFIKMAPFFFTEGMSSFTVTGLAIWQYISPIAQALTQGRYYPESYSTTNAALWKFLCYPYPIQMKLCQILDMWSFGFDYDQIDPETLPVTLLHLIETSSIKTVSHLSQLMTSNKFQQFDYGKEVNLRKYGTPHPPEYDLSRMRVPTYLIRSENDLTSTRKGVERFNGSLPETVKPYDIYVVKNDNFNHIDFVFAKDVKSLLYDHLLDFMSTL